MARNYDLLTDFILLRSCGSHWHDESNYEYQGAYEGTLMETISADEVMEPSMPNGLVHIHNLGAVDGFTHEEYKQDQCASIETDGLNRWAAALQKFNLHEDPPMKVLQMMNLLQFALFSSDQKLEEQVRCELEMEVDLTQGSNDLDAKTIRLLGQKYGIELADFHDQMTYDGTIPIFDDAEAWKAWCEAKQQEMMDSAAAEQGRGAANGRVELK